MTAMFLSSVNLYCRLFLLSPRDGVSRAINEARLQLAVKYYVRSTQ
jgi:hypothetical protein